MSNSVSVDDALHRNCGGFTAADAQRRDPALQVLRLQRMQQRDDQPRAGAADRVTQRAAAAVDVKLLAGDPKIAVSSHRHHPDRLIDLEQLDTAELPPPLV